MSVLQIATFCTQGNSFCTLEKNVKPPETRPLFSCYAALWGKKTYIDFPYIAFMHKKQQHQNKQMLKATTARQVLQK